MVKVASRISEHLSSVTNILSFLSRNELSTSRFASRHKDSISQIRDARTVSPSVTIVLHRLVLMCRVVNEDARKAHGGRRRRPWGRLEPENMVHEGTGLWHAAGFNASKWLMIIIHGYRVTTLVLYILLNVLVRTGEYNHLPVSPSAGYVFLRVVCARPPPFVVKAERIPASRKSKGSFERHSYWLLPFILSTWHSRILSKVYSANITLPSV